ncbi:hypothetical protein FKM82_022566 [Ascaphus truei]
MDLLIYPNSVFPNSSPEGTPTGLVLRISLLEHSSWNHAAFLADSESTHPRGVRAGDSLPDQGKCVTSQTG